MLQPRHHRAASPCLLRLLSDEGEAAVLLARSHGLAKLSGNAPQRRQRTIQLRLKLGLACVVELESPLYFAKLHRHTAVSPFSL